MWRGKLRAVQIASSPRHSERLCRPDLRKASGFPTNPCPSFSSAQAGRLSLPACAEEVVLDARYSERRSLSASQAAEPQVIVDRSKPNLDKPEVNSPLLSKVCGFSALLLPRD